MTPSSYTYTYTVCIIPKYIRSSEARLYKMASCTEENPSSTEENPSVLPASEAKANDDKSLEEFKQNVLNRSDLGDCFSTISPDSSVVRTEYEDDLFEDIFYKTKRDEACITVTFVSSGFYNSFHDKILSDFSSSIDCDETNQIYKCTTHIRSLKCDMKLDGKSKSVAVTGIGRIMWRKEFFPGIAKIIFKQYAKKSENYLDGSLAQSSQYDVLTAEKVENNPQPTDTVQVVFSSTPLIGRKNNQTVNCDSTVQPPCTPIVPQVDRQTTVRRPDTQPNCPQSTSTDTMTTVRGSEVQTASVDQQQIFSDAQFVQVPVQS